MSLGVMEHQRWHVLPPLPGADGPAWLEIDGWYPTKDAWMLVSATFHIVYGEGALFVRRPIWGWARLT